MAKKSFKTGLDNLIEDNYENIKDHVTKQENKNSSSDNSENNHDEKVQYLMQKIEKLMYELHKWRTGQLDLDKFISSLAKSGLKYNADTNSFEKI